MLISITFPVSHVVFRYHVTLIIYCWYKSNNGQQHFHKGLPMYTVCRKKKWLLHFTLKEVVLWGIMYKNRMNYNLKTISTFLTWFDIMWFVKSTQDNEIIYRNICLAHFNVFVVLQATCYVNCLIAIDQSQYEKCQF